MGKYSMTPATGVERLRLVCMKADAEKVKENLKQYDFLHYHDEYTKESGWTQIIVDSDRDDLDMDFVNKFNKEVDNCLGTFEEYSPQLD